MILCFLFLFFLICVIDIMLIQGTFVATFIVQIDIQFGAAATLFGKMHFIKNGAVLYCYCTCCIFGLIFNDFSKMPQKCRCMTENNFTEFFVFSFILYASNNEYILVLRKKLLHSRLLSWEINWSGALHKPNEHYKNKDDIIRKLVLHLLSREHLPRK